MTNHMGNNQIKKRAADLHNKKRREAHVERVRIEQDKIDNPEKYARKLSGRKGIKRALLFASLGLSTTAFDNRHLK